MVDRIRSLLKLKNINAAQFADQIGVQRSSISHVLSGRNKPSLEFIQKILKSYPDISSDWLLNGNEKMGAKSKSSNSSLFDIPETDEQFIGNIGKMRPELIKKDIVTDKGEKQLKSTDDKSIERVIIFYTDGKFREYKP